MAYTPATKLPTIAYFQWARPDAPNPRLAQAINETDTTLVFSDPPLDHAGAVITLGFLMGIATGGGYTETVYVPPGALSVDGLTATGVVRGIRLEGLDFTTGDPTLASAFNVDSAVYCNISAVNFLLMVSAMQGGIASGGTVWQIGTNADLDITVYASNGDVNKPFWRYDSGSDQWIFSNDGVSSSPFGTGAGIVAGGGITLAAGVVSVNLGDTTKFVLTSAGAGDSGKVPRLNGSGKLDDSFIAGANFTVVAGEDLLKGAPCYIKIADGKAYNASSAAVGEALENFSAFAGSTVLSGANVNMKAGPIVDVFSGLSIGSVYYLTDTPGVIDVTPGTFTKAVLLATSATSGELFNPQSTRVTAGTTTVSGPGIGLTTTTTVQTGFLPKIIELQFALRSVNAAGTNRNTATFSAIFNGTTLLDAIILNQSQAAAGGGSTFVFADSVLGNAMTDFAALGSCKVVAQVGVDTSYLKLDISAITATSFTVRLTNTISAGAGSVNVNAGTITYKVTG